MLAKRSGVLGFLDDLAAFPTVFPVRIFRAAARSHAAQRINNDYAMAAVAA
jgi:hypothetical protein